MPGRVVNSCFAPVTLTAVMAAPSSEERAAPGEVNSDGMAITRFKGFGYKLA